MEPPARERDATRNISSGAEAGVKSLLTLPPGQPSQASGTPTQRPTMSDQPEFYPMPSFPILAVSDVGKSSRWYQDVLGFQHVFTMPGPGGLPALAHLRWLKYADLLLRAGPPLEGKKGIGISLNYAMLDRSLEELAARARE